MTLGDFNNTGSLTFTGSGTIAGTDTQITVYSPVAIRGGLSGSNGFTMLGPNMLTLSGSSTYSGMTNVSGGTLVLSGSNAFSDGTVVTGGSLLVMDDEALADGTSLTVGDASAFSPLEAASVAAPASPAISPVPEPGTLLLLAVGLGGAAICRKYRRRQTVFRRSRTESLHS